MFNFIFTFILMFMFTARNGLAILRFFFLRCDMLGADGGV